jgi:hypothetical protein
VTVESQHHSHCVTNEWFVIDDQNSPLRERCRFHLYIQTRPPYQKNQDSPAFVVLFDGSKSPYGTLKAIARDQKRKTTGPA